MNSYITWLGLGAGEVPTVMKTFIKKNEGYFETFPNLYNPRKPAEVPVNIGFLDKSKRNATTFNWGPGMSTRSIDITSISSFSKKLLLFIFNDSPNHI